MDINLDKIEINKFEAMASQWWDPKGSCRPLHDLNPIRIQFIADHTELKQKTVIDIGCGGGILSESLAKRGALVTGLEVSQAALEVAELHARENNLSHLTYVESTAEEYAKTHAGHFDVVTCMELLEHVPNPYSLVEACAKLVKPKGHLFFSTLNRTIKSYFLAIMGAEYLFNLLPRHTHQYDKFIRPAELDRWLRQTGLSLQTISGIDYNPFSHTAKISTDPSVNYIVYASLND